MPSTVFGLPFHPLVVHATVVIVPTAAVVVMVAALSRRFRTWAGYLPVALSAVAVVLVPLSTSSGEELEESMAHSALIEQHARLADQLLPLVLGLLAVSLLQLWVRRRAMPAWLIVGTAVLAVAVSAGTVVEVVRIGHSGAEAAWSDVATDG